MTTIITRLSDKILTDIKTADEIWVAVALISKDGLNFFLNNLKPTCRQNYLIGIDLPTDPKALKKLNELQLTSDLSVRIHTDKECYHPKLYLLRTKKSYSAYVGSANCTNGGFFNNIELTANFTDNASCEQLIKWFFKYYDAGKPVTTQFVEEYQADFIERQERKKREEKIVKKEKQDLNEEFEATLSEKKRICSRTKRI